MSAMDDPLISADRARRRPRFSVFLTAGTPWERTLECIRLADRLGFEALWVPDHLYSPMDRQKAQLDGWATIAAAAMVTERIRLGVLVSNPAYRAPAVVASLALSLDHLSTGRAEVAIGTGWFEPDFHMVGEALWSPAERVERLWEAAQIVDRLMRGDARPYNGAHYRVADAEVAVAPIQQPRPPLTLAANGPKAIAVAAELADTWTTMPDRDFELGEFAGVARERAATLDRACEAIGRDPGSLRRSVLLSPPHFDPWGSVESLASALEPYRQAGFDDFVLRWPSEHGLDVVESVAKDMLSADY